MNDKLNKFILTDSEKRASDYKVAKEYMLRIALSSYPDPNRTKLMDENYDLHSGRWTALERETETGSSFIINGEEVALGGGVVRHYPILDKVTKTVVANIISTPLVAMVSDNSPESRNSKKRFKIQKAKEYLYNTTILPTRQQVIEEVKMATEGGQQLPEDINSYVEEEVKKRTPEDVMQALEMYKSPEQKIYQSFLDFSIRRNKAKEKFDIGGENAVVTAEEYYKLTILNGHVNLEVLNPKYVTWGGSQNTEFVEDGSWATYHQYITIDDAISRYGKELKNKDIDKLGKYSTYGYRFGVTPSEEWSDGIDRVLVDALGSNEELLKSIDIRTRDGQRKLSELYRSLGTSSGYAGGMVRETYVTWKWNRRLKLVERLNQETGELEEFFYSDYYIKNPALGDVRVSNIVVPQSWEGVILGEYGKDAIFVNVRPLPYQYGSDKNPFEVKLSIYGGVDNTFMNNVENASLVSLGKPWSYRYNLLMKKITEDEATDFGSVLMMSLKNVPDGFTPAEWIKALYVGKIGLYKTNLEDGTVADKTSIFGVNLSNMSNQMAALKKLEYFESKIYSSTYHNKSAVGNISPYATNQNIESSQNAASKQMYRFYNRRKIIKERVLNAILKLSIIAYKDNSFVKSLILDDASLSYFNANYDNISPSEADVYVVDNIKDKSNLEEMKRLALTLLQNNFSAKDITALMNATSMVEVEELMYKSEREAQKRAEQEHERRMLELEKQSESDMAKLKVIEQLKSARQAKTDEVKLAMAELNSKLLANANDINENNINDSFEKMLIEIESKERMQDKELEFKREELKKKIEAIKKKSSDKKK